MKLGNNLETGRVISDTPANCRVQYATKRFRICSGGHYNSSKINSRESSSEHGFDGNAHNKSCAIQPINRLYNERHRTLLGILLIVAFITRICHTRLTFANYLFPSFFLKINEHFTRNNLVRNNAIYIEIFYKYTCNYHF